MLQAVESCGPLTRRFRLQMRCHNCLRESSKVLEFPDHDDAPMDVDELMECVTMDRLRYRCTQCDSAIGIIVSISQSNRRRD